MVESNANLKQALVAAAKAISDHDFPTAEWLMSELRNMVSISGEPLQRLGAYMLEALFARFSSSQTSTYNPLSCKEQTNSYMHLLYEISPYFKFGYISANGVIAEAMETETRIHIIDFQIGQGSQWVSLIRDLADRASPAGPPHIRITAIHDDPASSELDIVGKTLSKVANSCNLPFEFHFCDLELQDLVFLPGEALAVNFPFVLHRLPDENVSPENHRDKLLRLVKSWSPKVVTLVEQESNTNTTPFFPRFLETLNYYNAIFESIEVSLPRDCQERIKIEQHLLAREIVNIIACEGAERVERHEVLGKWRSRFLMAGFRPYPLSPTVCDVTRSFLHEYDWSYGIVEWDGALYLGWMNRVLVASCAWK